MPYYFLRFRKLSVKVALIFATAIYGYICNLLLLQPPLALRQTLLSLPPHFPTCLFALSLLLLRPSVAPFAFVRRRVPSSLLPSLALEMDDVARFSLLTHARTHARMRVALEGTKGQKEERRRTETD